MSSERAMACPWCGSDRIASLERGAFHPLVPGHGPFDLFTCRDCGSSLTFPMPSTEVLDRLYGSFVAGLPAGHRAITADDPQQSIYRLCASRIGRAIGAVPERPFTWIDAGAGDGALSIEMARAFPRARGLAIDQHARPATLDGASRIDWAVHDLNGSSLPGIDRADVVVALAVWEHVTDPLAFAISLLRLTAPGGLLYLVCPDFGSGARRLLGRRWPYYSPGEHLCMPTRAGAAACLSRARDACGMPDARIASRPLWLPYTARYIAQRAGLAALARACPRGLAVPVPAGALESTVTRG
ncbi:MAG: class I SAM-dependent methyltransferase [Vicinamibacterales bacterium]